MLIFTRRIGERIMIGEDIEVVVQGISGSTVRLGIHAPKAIPVDREEIYRRKLLERQPADESEPAPAPSGPTITMKRRGARRRVAERTGG